MKLISLALAIVGLLVACFEADATPVPRVLDPRLKIELFAAEPQIVTPTGITVDDKGRVLCIESHTHFRPKDYQGPATDRIRMFQDTDGDGRADRITTFYEGTTFTMNLAVYHDGSVYVATRREVFRLRDKDGDGKAEERTPIVRLETKGDYPHNGLSGFAFDFPGNVYFGFGENLGEPYKLIGSDGVTLTGGDAGNVYRCGPNGEKLHRIATGFWNPFHLATDSFGRLFAVDNDPDARPPCRLLHVVEGGDYGFRFRLGRDGLHPFQSWNGEVPGTLPMVNGTGEAPSGIIAYESDGLPDDYFGDLLLTSWGDHRIERHRLTPRGASYGSKVEIIAKGNEDFRPVGIALAPDGSLYLSDWVKKDYNLHNHGRIWRLRSTLGPEANRKSAANSGLNSRHRSTRESVARKFTATAAGRKAIRELLDIPARPQIQATAVAALALGTSKEETQALKQRDLTIALNDRYPAEVQSLATQLSGDELLPLIERDRLHAFNDDSLLSYAALMPASVRAEQCRRFATQRSLAHLIDCKELEEPDPFLNLAIRRVFELTDHEASHSPVEPRPACERLAFLLVQRSRNDTRGRDALPQYLSDPDINIRFAALQWVAEVHLATHRPRIDAALRSGPVTQPLFDVYLATLEALDGQKDNRRWDQRVDKYVVDLAAKRETPIEVRRLAIRRLRPNHPAFTAGLFDELMATGDAGIQREAVRTFRESRRRERNERLTRVVQDTTRSTDLRADAMLGLDSQDSATRTLLVSTALGDDAALRDEALRSLRGAALEKDERDRLTRVGEQSPVLRDLIARVLEPNVKTQRPNAKDSAGWQQLLAGTGEAKAGERIFFHSKSAGCSKCHQVSARGGAIGPDLTLTGTQLSRERLIESIVNPGREIAPQYVTWNVLKKDGTTFTGVFLGEDGGRNQRYGDSQGNVIALKAEDIDDRQPSEKSLMPDDLPHQLTIQEFRDLLAFLTAPK